MGLSIARAGADYATAHTRGDTTHPPSPYASNGNTVYINGLKAVGVGDSTVCGEKALQGSGTVFINGKPAHRNSDKCDSHYSFSPSICVSGSSVYAG